ncbi:glycosyltransferase family protein [Tautonia sociabilis]|uniref:Glycosyl transferase family 28 C-terminal domain-containing protein n=1 Tax=Tautonia sociabilis TaxID=2080755 RepID=A0A432MJF3_9BACT|nr:hypothetical protein [Tautonia sociabilis]RUL87521.1 hypothetical protein TsocGM_11840 [Tautonia sociabilis]
MGATRALAAYVTSHGFGHLNRTVAVLNRLPEDVPLIIRSAPDLFDHWRERLRRPAELLPHVSDAGAVNPPGNSADTDGPASLERAARVHAEAMGRIDEYTDELRSGAVAAVLCDATPVPLVAARRAGVPGFLLGNFTWADIYHPHAKKMGGDWPTFVRELHRCYRHATAIFRCAPHLSMAGLAPIVDVGMVVTPGRDRRGELRAGLGLSERDRIVYMYLGRYGQDDYEWGRIARLGALGIHFVGFHEAPASAGPVPNLHVVPASEWTGADLAASADVVVAKAGYGTVCEAIVAGTPMIHPPRTGFAEYRALALALKSWGGGVPASRRAFDRLRIERLLDRAFALEPGPPPFPADGASRVATHLAAICRGQPEGGRPLF